MKKIKILPKITKTYILDRISQEKIMYFYTKIPVNDFTLTGNSFRSPLRIDKNPTCNYYYNRNGKLRLKDWGGHFDGDIFDIIGKDTKLNPRTPQGFQLILHKIARDFNLDFYSKQENRDIYDSYIQAIKKTKKTRVIKIAPRKFSILDNKYWYGRYGINRELIKQAKIIPVENIYLENRDGYINKIYTYRTSDPAYAYYGGKEKGVVIWKVYFPLRKSYRFLVNKAVIQGEHLIKPSPIGIFNKAFKDSLCMRTFGIQSVAIPAESILISKDDYYRISSYFDYTASVMDWDRAGILMANKMRRTYNVNPIMFTRGYFGQFDYGVKDFSDFREVYGKDKTRDLIRRLLDDYREALEHISSYNYNSLSWTQQEILK